MKMSSKNYNRQFTGTDIKISTQTEVVPPTTTLEQKIPTHNELHEALMWVEDMFERSLIQFCMVGDIGRQMFDHELPEFKSSKVEVAVLNRHLTESGFSIFKSLIKESKFGSEFGDDLIKIDHKGTPIEIHIVHKYYSFLENPDMRCYTLSEFRIPNPFENYWNSREELAW